MNLVQEFEQWLHEEGKVQATIQSYVGDVQGFQKYLNEKVADENQLLSRFAFVRYKQYLLDEGFAIATINKKINSLKVYNDFLRMKGMVSESFIHMKRDRVMIAAGSEHVVTALSDKEVEQLLFYLEVSRKVTMRNKLIVYLLLYTGVRVSELINIKLSDIEFLTHMLTVQGKGGKIREISMRKDVLELINQYMKGERVASKFQDSEYLLVSQRAPKMHRDAVRDWLAKISNELGFKLHPHLFRHTFCTRLLKKGVDLTTVSKLAGHATVNMTAKFYIQTSREEKQRAVDLL
ncbi:integrase [Alkalihalobacillus alcalophilus ATCC 27647 = CGMCC 1.3604]|uniref:Integrase n=1 Tax=Alkalihalobacillus alcalophilus ATCC 27647 = CGMCC 1.3604 TaxID=1218173 RepID=A0A094YUS3_ALKAL|nr:tyrosine-type recombinase/integrase [Alkalihalobacillus alcalophilus]KGA97232.1 integrase [Alkalihalobacillus alcalophilus ATCC 27647 = CGMCC 1.3604]MED1561525.1 tyrosine-type recombinase/integrase [Alkalihalobacillus alcalophilus]THG89534.1 integrase [Alkalihalobacillus alcalophilus ATCC 27647 = CGMCC 1.3604]